MGAWGFSTFENEDAMTWIQNLTPQSVLDEVEAAIDLVASRGLEGYLETQECCCALAAAEIVAASLGRPAEIVPPEIGVLQAHINARSLPTLAHQALTVIERIEAESELRELHEAADGMEAWMDQLDDLRVRLGA
jgi:hypothetical protein